jgi:hypothetical protein
MFVRPLQDLLDRAGRKAAYVANSKMLGKELRQGTASRQSPMAVAKRLIYVLP